MLKMKSPISVLFFAFVFCISSPSWALKCMDVFKKTPPVVQVNLGKPANPQQAQPIKLKQGETIWGLYDCLSCGNTNSMKPKDDGRIQCVGCGSPHTTEAYRRPALFEKDGSLWLVDPGQISRTQQEKNLAQNGELIGCPFCGNTDFKLSGSCATCGASAKDPAELRSSLTRLRSGTAMPKSDFGSNLKDFGSKPTDTTSSTSTKRGSVNSSSPENRMTPLRKRVLGMAAGITLAAATTFGTVWGLSTHSEVGRVVQIESSQVVIEYTVDNLPYSVELARPAGETLEWRLGEPITISFINWKMGDPSGGIRGNGDVLPYTK
jgi:ribosomal protein L37AE/L43A